MGARQAFFQRLSASLIVPITILPLAAILLAIGQQGHIPAVEAAGQALIRSWLPLFYGIGISLGFTDNDGVGALSVATGFLVMSSVAEAVAVDPSLNVGVLGGILAGAVCTWVYNRVKRVELPEYLALFSGKRLGPIATAVAGVFLGFAFGLSWPAIQHGILALGRWIYGSGAVGVFAYGSILRVLIPTGLHHILMQLVDTQMGGWVASNGQMVAGELYRFLAGDPSAGRILSGFFVTLGFSSVGAALAIMHEARPEQRRRVAGLMTTGILTAAILGVTEPIEFAFILASPILFGMHVVFSGLASLMAYALDIRLGGYALPLAVVNSFLPNAKNVLLLVPLGLAFTALYYFSFRAVIRWLRPPILGQVAEQPEADSGVRRLEPVEEGMAFLQALGGAGNVLSIEACMTRLRLQVAATEGLDRSSLDRLGVKGVVDAGGGLVQVVVGPRAGAIAEKIRPLLAESIKPLSNVQIRSVLVYSPFTGRLVPLEHVPDPVFAGRVVGDGIAVEAQDGEVVSPVHGEVIHIAPGGHAFGIQTPEGLDVLVHIGIDTVTIQGETFSVAVRAGDTVAPGTLLCRFDPAIVVAHGKSLVSPVLITNPERVGRLAVLSTGEVRRGQPLFRVEL